MNSIMERWVQTCRHGLLDRTLTWNERHLRHCLHQFELHHNGHRPHQAMCHAAPLRAIPRTDHRSRPYRALGHLPQRPAQGHHPRVSTCRLNWTDVIFGRRRLSESVQVFGAETFPSASLIDSRIAVSMAIYRKSFSGYRVPRLEVGGRPTMGRTDVVRGMGSLLVWTASTGTPDLR